MTILIQDNFDTEAAGAISPLWKAISGTWAVGTTAPVTGTHSFGSASNGDGDIAVCTGIPVSADMGIQFDQVVQQLSTSNYRLIAGMVRCDAAVQNGYVATFKVTGTTGSFQLFKRVSGSFSLLTSTDVNFACAVGDILHCRVTIVGTVLSMYLWANGATQPTTPIATATDSSVTSAGYVGLYNQNSNPGTAPLSAIDGLIVDSVGSVTVPVASAVSLSGPSTALVSAASTPFTVQVDGTLAASVVVTPSDGAGGTFTPASVTLGVTGQGSPTFTYTPSSSGTKSITLTNTGSLSNPAAKAVTVTTPAAATALTLTGPAVGYAGLATSNFTASANGFVNGTLTVTPGDGGAGGTFSPASLAMSGNSPSGTFVYTPASTGVKTVSLTNNQSLTNPNGIAVSVMALIRPSNAAVYASPMNWDQLSVGDLGAVQPCSMTTACGAYMRTTFSGSATFAALLDVSTYGAIPTGGLLITARLDKGAQEVTLPVQQNTPLHTFFTGLSTGQHEVELYLLGTAENNGTRWAAAGVSPTSALRVVGFVFDAGVTVTAPTVLPGFDIFFGDSITESVRAAGTTSEPLDHGRSYPWFLAPALGVERCVLGYGATGWTGGGSGGMPTFPTWWNTFTTGRARPASPQPRAIFIMHGQNDGNNAGVTTAAVALLPQLRARFPAAWIFLCPPPSGLAAVQLRAGVTQYRTANAGDQRVQYLDWLANFSAGGFTGLIGSPTADSVDGTHPLERTNGRIAAAIYTAAAPYLNKSRYFGVGGVWN